MNKLLNGIAFSPTLFSKYQQRVPYDLLSGLAHALLDGTVFEIVQGLSEVQHLEEKSLFNQRVKQTNDHKGIVANCLHFAFFCVPYLCDLVQ